MREVPGSIPGAALLQPLSRKATSGKHLNMKFETKEKMVPCGLEPRTLRLLAVRSNQLSYETSECDARATTLGVRARPKAQHTPALLDMTLCPSG